MKKFLFKTDITKDVKKCFDNTRRLNELIKEMKNETTRHNKQSS